MIEKYVEGLEGEKVIRDFLIKRGIHFFQADLIFKSNGKWYLGEVKHQETFKPPPFYGHGLPLWQVEARLNFQKEKGIRIMLFIIDKKTNIVYWQFMDILIKGRTYQTRGAKPRIIFPLENYKILI
jgi:hypothetical protein